MSWVAVAGVAVTAVGSAVSADGSRKAAHEQQDAASAASAQQRADMKPWMDAGKEGLDTLRLGLLPGGEFSTKFTMADATNSDAMKEAQRGGSESIQNSAAAKGGLIGTNVMQDLNKFGAANAAQYQNQAFNQWLAQRNQKLGATQSLAQVGQTATTGVADNVSNLTLAAGNAGAAGTVGQSNAIGGGVSNIGDQISMMSGMFGNKGSSVTPVAAPTPYAGNDYSNNSTYGAAVGTGY